MGSSVGPEGLPWPEGNPGGIADAAHHAGAVAQQLRDSMSGIPSLTGPVQWAGLGYDSFVGSVQRHTAQLGRAATAFERVEHALSSLAQTLHDAQEEVLKAAHKLHDAREAERKAEQAAEAARATANDTKQAADAASALPGGAVLQAAAVAADQYAQGQERTAYNAGVEAQAVETWALGVARRACDRAEQADQRTAGLVESLGLLGDSPLYVGAPSAPIVSSGLSFLGHTLFGSGAADRRSFLQWLTAPPPLPPPPKPRTEHHVNVLAAVGVGIAAGALDIFAAAQGGLDPLADAAAGSADAAEARIIVGTEEEVAASEGAAGEAAVTATEAEAASLPAEERAAAQAWDKELETEATPAADARAAETGAGRGFASGKPPHTAEVTVTRNGEPVVQQTFKSGNMSEEEKALGFPQSTLATHTEARAVRDVELQPGDEMVIKGEYPPCPSCKGRMNFAARSQGAKITYEWPGGTWTAGG
jgi:hypothetical protein